MANTKSIDLELSSSQYLSISDTNQTGLNFTGDCSFMFWFNKEGNFTTYNDILSKWGATGNKSYSVILYEYLGEYQLRFHTSNDGSANSLIWCLVGDLDAGTWYHGAITYDDSEQEIKFYLNGSLIDTKSSAFSGIYDSTSSFIIGSYRDGYGEFFDGKLDEISVWNKVLSSTEISDNYNSGDGEELTGSETNLQGYWRFEDDLTDLTSNGNDLTNNNSATFSTDVPFSGGGGSSSPSSSPSSSVSSSVSSSPSSSASSSVSSSPSSSVSSSPSSSPSSSTSTSPSSSPSGSTSSSPSSSTSSSVSSSPSTSVSSSPSSSPSQSSSVSSSPSTSPSSSVSGSPSSSVSGSPSVSPSSSVSSSPSTSVSSSPSSSPSSSVSGSPSTSVSSSPSASPSGLWINEAKNSATWTNLSKS